MSATLLITATVFDDRTRIAFSGHFPERINGIGQLDEFSPISQIDEACSTAWAYLLMTLPESGWLPSDYRVRLSVIDRRPGTRASSRGCGKSLTS